MAVEPGGNDAQHVRFTASPQEMLIKGEYARGGGFLLLGSDGRFKKSAVGVEGDMMTDSIQDEGNWAVEDGSVVLLSEFRGTTTLRIEARSGDKVLVDRFGIWEKN